MRLKHIHVKRFAGINDLDLDLDHDFVVIHGPNDLGKTTLARAIQAALLFRIKSKVWQPFQQWGWFDEPTIELHFDVARDDATDAYLLRKSPSASLLQRGVGGAQFQDLARGNRVDEHLFGEVLNWGLPTRFRGRGNSFLTRILFPGQDEVGNILSDTGVDADAQGSARDWLVRALEAESLPPEFSELFGQVEARCAEVYTATFRLSRTASSPLFRLSEAIDDIRKEIERLEGSRSRLSDVEEGRQEREAEIDAIEREIGQLSERIEDAERHLEAQATHVAARAALVAAETRAEAVERAEAMLAAQEKSVAAIRLELEQEEALLAAARSARHKAMKGRADAEAGNRQHQRELAIAKLQAEIGEITARQQDLLRAALQYDQRATLAEKRTATRTASEALQTQVNAAKAAVDRARAETAASQSAELAEAEVACVKADELVAESGQRLAKIAGKPALPSVPDIDSLDDTQRRLAVARASVNVGLELRFAPRGPKSVKITRDGDRGTSRELDSAESWRAERTIELQIERAGTIEVRAGDAAAHDEFNRLVAAWDVGLSPWTAVIAHLSQDGTDDERERRIIEWLRDETRARASEREAAEALAEQAANLRPSEARMEMLRAAVDSPSSDALTAARHTFEQLEKDYAHARARADELDAEWDAMTMPELGAVDGIDAPADDPGGIAERLRGRASALTIELAELADRLATETAAESPEDTSESEPVDEAGTEVRRLEDVVTATRERLTEATQDMGALDARCESARHDAADDDLRALLAALIANPAPSGPALTEAELASTRERVEGLQGRRHALEMEVARDGGMLHGRDQSIDEEIAELASRRESLEREEESMRLDYEGWRLLREVMVEVEDAEAGNLGASIAPLVSDRIARLAGPNYALSINAALGIDGQIVTRGGPQEISQISVGAREQMATIFRLALAEALKTCIVLDDQLAQSDPKRMIDLCEMMAQVARRAQVIVFTCRPDEYASDTAHLIDLAPLLGR